MKSNEGYDEIDCIKEKLPIKSVKYENIYIGIEIYIINRINMLTI